METIEFSDATQLTHEQRSKVVQAMANGTRHLPTDGKNLCHMAVLPTCTFRQK